jgi:hypothetical protein
MTFRIFQTSSVPSLQGLTRNGLGQEWDHDDGCEGGGAVRQKLGISVSFSQIFLAKRDALARSRSRSSFLVSH